MNVFPGRISLVRHLGLYNAFHQHRGNQLVHTLASPFVYLSALVLLQVLLPAVLIPFVVTSLVLLSLADWRATLVYGLGVIAACVVAIALSHAVAAMPLLLGALLVQTLAWTALIFLGHGVYERPVIVDGRPVSTGVYFHRGYNRARNLGVAPNAFDVFLQFSIAPLAHTNDLLFSLGLRKDLHEAMTAERTSVLERLRVGCPPLAEDELAMEDGGAQPAH
ncbi:MAG: hypothetical protein Q8L14_40050 [Myxococcales bacterium]|nr:hypothetical protein [Myxococcales bacterium]